MHTGIQDVRINFHSPPFISQQKMGHDYEFGGPIGAAFNIVMLPLTILFLGSSCKVENFLSALLNLDLSEVSSHLKTADIFSSAAFLVFLCWMGFQVFLALILPGDMAEGVDLGNNRRLKYPMSGHLQFWITLCVLLFCWPFPEQNSESINIQHNGTSLYLGAFPLDWIYDNYFKLATSSIMFSSALSVYLYYRSFYCQPDEVASHGNSGNWIYDFFMGRELNPRVGSFDLKVFCELRPGLIGWVVINMGCLFKQIKDDGSATWEMLLVNLFQGLYVWDALYNERAILTTMDVTTGMWDA